ncbi:AAA family ATPase [Staphylococcus hominis]|jgi:5-methylcytosine-specific restriction protein B|uniref:AAA family ATPase n=1 Tax=Staphylococcus hominis TaxID=1290 RepID=UPI00066D53B4|nr:AAA family ATPase [Staphylococcus hominis]OFM60230.1 GTPase [Staphylococcus sp. HMSC062C01]MBC3066793.1 AAA family ATPase [Staphylococcus hominis]MBC3073270.1 AAA family ATPase [Staphylococcus hominis]MCI2862868.1 AAA family ATPase [Staphylococcus hominis]MCI2866932.1 AAA family ATPase [Staphylococcus hominis]
MDYKIDKTWAIFYKALAHKLLEYQNCRDQLIEKIRELYINTQINMPKLEINNEMIDMDPFTVFGLFNKSSMTKENRIKIIEEMAKLFDVKADIPQNFDGIPTVMNLRATFYNFKNDREAQDIENLWSLFEIALLYSSDKSEDNENNFKRKFNQVMAQPGIGMGKLTSGLFWIDSDTFANLDSRAIWYIFEESEISTKYINFEVNLKKSLTATTYLMMIEKLKLFLKDDNYLNDFIDLSYEAWRKSKEIKQSSKVKDIDADKDLEVVNYWIYSPKPQDVDFASFIENGEMSIGYNELEDFSNYASKEEINQKLQQLNHNQHNYIHTVNAIWEFSKEMKRGDIVYVKKGQTDIVGWGVVSSNHQYKNDKNIIQLVWKEKGNWKIPIKTLNKTLTKITPYSETIRKFNELFSVEHSDGLVTTQTTYPVYTAEQFLDDVFMNEEDYDTLVQLIRRKKNVILQGPPGVGKTYAAKRLAYSMMGVKDKERVKLVQFHQSYAYEDFVMGYRPTETGFELRTGAFYNFCKQAEEDSEKDYFFIIDEINRGNLSKIFGELFMLIENDKRGMEIELLYADEKFCVPDNVYIIGMMNTADRSLAILDYALRRRFAFFDMNPAFETIQFKQYQENLKNPQFDALIDTIQALNVDIREDDMLGEGFVIGHSYFSNIVNITESELSNIIEFEIIPLLKEYWFDDPSKVDIWKVRLRDAIQ